MRFKNLDLNLLVALDILLEERSVSAAAVRLNLSQSAMSGALARLREHFQDELLAQSGRVMLRTALAENIAGPVRQLMLQIESTVGAGAQFDPATSQRKFTILASDYVMEVLLLDLVRKVAAAAPGIKLDMNSPGDDVAGPLESGEVDLLIMPDLLCSADHPRQLLLEETHVIVGCANNSALNGDMTTNDFFAMGHVVVRFAMSKQLSLQEQHVRTLSQDRRIEIVAPSFSSVPGLVVGTKRVGLMQRRLAEIAARRLPLRIVEPPFVIPNLRETIQYNRVRENDTGLAWLRGQMHTLAAALG